MRVTIKYQYKLYPLSEKINKKSKRIGYYTSPHLAVAYGFCMGLIAFYAIAEEMLFWVTIICSVLWLMILPPIRRSAYQKLDVEYMQLLKSMEAQKRAATVSAQPVAKTAHISVQPTGKAANPPAQPIVKRAGNSGPQKMVCPHCGARQPEGTEKCKYCGTAMK